ncbi:KR domain-containing protein [Aspergillus crustosus]
MLNVLQQCSSEKPPIQGVIQCAAVLDDAIYNNMTHEQWENSIKPKIHGSWLLHKLLPHNLQFFIMLSSIAGVGLPAVSVDLGLMLGIGLIAERGGATNLKKWEAVGIREKEFHNLITAAINGCWSGHPLPAQVICGLPTGGILQSEGLKRPFYFDDPRFSYLKKKDLGSTGEQQSEPSEPLLSQLSKVESMREAVDIVTSGLSARLAGELKTDTANIDSTRPLHSYGVDSLLAVEIRNWVVSNLQPELSLFDLLSGGSISALAARIAAISKAVPDTVQ